jgi:hypothetical protein
MNISTPVPPSGNQRIPLLINEPIAKALYDILALEDQPRALDLLAPAPVAQEPPNEGIVSQYSDPKIKKRIRSKMENVTVPPRLLLSPQFRTVPTVLTAPKDMKGASRQLKAAFKASGALYQLAPPPNPSLPDLAPLPEKRHTWFSHYHDILYFPCPVNNKENSLYKRTQYVMMEDIRYYNPRSLTKAIMPLVRPEFFPNLKCVYLSSGLIYANNTMWTPNAISRFFGSEYVLLVNLLDPTEVLNMRIKLRNLNLLDENENISSWICDRFGEKHGRFSWLCDEFDDMATRFLQPAYWQELKESFQGKQFLCVFSMISGLLQRIKHLVNEDSPQAEPTALGARHYLWRSNH